jgi:acyl-coenzyme A thioesterase PaaI-like protein
MEVTTVEYKINFLSSKQQGELRAVVKVVKGGKRISCRCTFRAELRL